jgi:O-antigen ligase
LHLDQLIYGLLLILAVSLPFEPLEPLVSFGFFNLNHLKVLEAAIALLWLLSLTRPGALRDLPRVTWLAGAFLAIALLSAVFAQTQRGEAIKFVGRLAMGLFGLLVVYQVVDKRPARIFGLLWAITLGASLSALLGLGEVAGWPALDPVLSVFKLAPTRVGANVRLSGSFQYATIAAMFFELAAPLALVLAATQRDRRRWILATGIAALCSVAVVLTITRAGIVALVASFVVLLALAIARPRWRRLALPTVLAGAAGGVALAGLAVGMPNFGSRFETENDWSWYSASYDVPSTITLASGTPTNAVVTARNTGEVSWTAGGPQAFALGYRWLSADAASQLDMPATILDLPRDVAPGDAVELHVDVATGLPPGDYRLAWGMLQQQVLWFHDHGYPDAETVVHVLAGKSSEQAVAMRPRNDLQPVLAPVPRTELWSAALTMARQHPLLGVGPDNFRHLYGTYLGLSAWDDRIHANNLYLELLADVGVLGTLVFGLLLGLPIAGFVRRLRTRTAPAQAILLAGVCASLLAYLLHSGLDAFLDFTSVYLLLWMIVGLGVAVLHLDACEHAAPAG